MTSTKAILPTILVLCALLGISGANARYQRPVWPAASGQIRPSASVQGIRMAMPNQQPTVLTKSSPTAYGYAPPPPPPPPPTFVHKLKRFVNPAYRRTMYDTSLYGPRPVITPQMLQQQSLRLRKNEANSNYRVENPYSQAYATYQQKQPKGIYDRADQEELNAQAQMAAAEREGYGQRQPERAPGWFSRWM